MSMTSFLIRVLVFLPTITIPVTVITALAKSRVYQVLAIQARQCLSYVCSSIEMVGQPRILSDTDS